MATVQNACACSRISARTTVGAAWLMINPDTTTASTPDASIASASRNAVNGISNMVTCPVSGSVWRLRTCAATQPVTAPTAAPPT